MYRPTWRMDDVFKQYVEKVSEVTTLSGNQVARLALFAAPFSAVFLASAADHRKKILGDVSLPLPIWSRSAAGLWLEEEWKDREEGDVRGTAKIGNVEVAI